MAIKIRTWHKRLKEYVQPSKYAVIDQNGEIGNDDLLVEQFTGLHDKNGKEIYEADVVMCYDDYIRVVEWCDESGAFVMRHLPESEYIDNLFMDDGSKLIIGNIHENPELLENKND